MVPLAINCWPEPAGNGVMNVNIEYSLQVDFPLLNVEVFIPLGTSEAPQIVAADGTPAFNKKVRSVIGNQGGGKPACI
jgi:hypothetical protein